MKTEYTDLQDTPQQAPQLASHIATYYQSITRLPLSRFIDCYVDNDLTALIIAGNPTPEQLSEAWFNINQEYIDALGDMEYRMYIKLMAETQVMGMNDRIIKNSVEILRLVYIKKYADAINKILHVNFLFDYANPDKYHHELTRAENRIKTNSTLILINEARIAEIEARLKESGRKPTREYFQTVLDVLSDHAKYLLPDSITVFQFCNRLKRLNEYCKTIESNNQTNNNGRRKD